MEIFERLYLYLFFFILMVPLTLIIFVVAALRGDHDAAGKRSYSVYLGAASIVTLLVLLSGAYNVVGGFVDLARADDSSSIDYSDDFEFGESSSQQDYGSNDSDQAWQQIVSGLILAGIAGALWRLHRNRVNDLHDDSDYPGSASERTQQATDYIIVFLALLFFLGASYTALYTIFQLISPDTFGLGDRADGWEQLVMSGVVAGEAYLAFSLYRANTFLTRPPASFTPPGGSTTETPAAAAPQTPPPMQGGNQL